MLLHYLTKRETAHTMGAIAEVKRPSLLPWQGEGES